MRTREVSVFIDESGSYEHDRQSSRYYLVCMVFHDQDNDIQPAINKLNMELSYLGLDDICIHTGPIIRMEEVYKNINLIDRRRIFNKMIAFIRQIEIKYHCFAIEKRKIDDVVDATGLLSKQISLFIKDHYEEFLSFDDVKIYYDNGQVEVSKILSSVFNALLPSPVFRKVMPNDYKLFQVADLFCSLKLVSLKMENNIFSKSERNFFGNIRDLKKNYLKPLQKKEWI